MRCGEGVADGCSIYNCGQDRFIHGHYRHALSDVYEIRLMTPVCCVISSKSSSNLGLDSDVPNLEPPAASDTSL